MKGTGLPSFMLGHRRCRPASILFCVTGAPLASSLGLPFSITGSCATT